MPRLISTTGGRDQFVSDDDPNWQSLVKSGDYKVADGETVSIEDAYGHQTVVGTDTFQKEQARGAGDMVEANEKVIKRARDERLKDETSTVGAFGRNLASGVSFGITDGLVDDETLEADAMHHGTASFLGQATGLVGSLALGNDLGLMKLFGKGAAAERGAAAGIRELAVTDKMLDAENVASNLSSNALMGGKAPLTAAERALGRAGKALDEGVITRNGLSNVPDDLIGLDAKGLKAAAVEEKAAISAQARLEKESLEELRKPLREELAMQVKEMHHELTAARPIHAAVAGADVRKLEGVGDIASQLNKSYRGLRSTLDNSIRIADDPGVLIPHLQMRQVALEGLQAKAPELRSFLGTDARAASLDFVDDALEQTKAQIEAIQRVSKSNPATSSRLLELQSGASPRLAAIEAAQEALKNAPEVGLMQKGLQAGAFAGGTALARMIPGVGAMAPFAGKWASDTIGKAFEHLAAGKAAVGDRASAALDKFLDVSRKAGNRVASKTGAITATKVLAQASFGPDSGAHEGKDLASLFKARSSEIRNQTMYAPDGSVVMRPEAREAMAKQLAPIATVNPLLADHLETIQTRKVEYVSSKMPRQPDVGGLQIGPDNWKPSELEMRSFARTVRAVEDPGSVEERLADGIITPEESEAYRAVYPERFAAMQTAIFEAAPSLSKTLPMKKKLALSIFTGVPLIPALQPNVLQVLQANYRVEPGSEGGTQAPSPQPNFGDLGSLKSSEKPTAAQQREGTV